MTEASDKHRKDFRVIMNRDLGNSHVSDVTGGDGPSVNDFQLARGF